MIIRNANTAKTLEAMKRGEWPEPDPEVEKAYEGIKQANQVPKPEKEKDE